MWEFTRFKPEYFRSIEDCILRLRELHIEADIILFHPYDRWGFSMLDREQSRLYLEYVTARSSAYSNAPGLRSGGGMWDELLAVPEDDGEFQRTGYRIYY